MEIKEISLFKYKHRVEKFFDNLYDGKFGIHQFTLYNDESGVIHIHDTKTKEHIASLVGNVLHTNDLSLYK